MKQKLLSLAALVFGVITGAQAGDQYGVDFNGANTFHGKATADYWTFNSAKHNFNAKFTGATYTVCGDEVEFKSGLKLEGATLVQYNAAAEHTLTIVASTWSTNTLKLDDVEIPYAATEAGKLTIGENEYSFKATSGTGYTEFVIEKLPIGTHKIGRGSGENGLFAAIVEYTGEAKTVLDKPTIDANEETGVVTIGSVENASSIAYEIVSIDKQDTVKATYTEPFTLTQDGYVNAWAVGEGSYANSQTESVTVALLNAKLDAPTLVQVNGTVGITTNQIKTKLEYSLDGENWVEATVNPTLTENGKVYARARRGETNISEVSEIDVTSAIAKPEGTKRVLLSYPEGQDADNEIIWTVAGVDFTMKIATNESKTFSSAKSITLPGEGENLSWKLSNGAGNKLTLPDGVVAKRATFYSYVNGTPGTSYWYEVNNDTIDAKVDAIAYMNATEANDPDIRVYDLGEEGVGEFTFTNKGVQLCFVIALDVEGLAATPYKIANTEAVGGTATVNAEAYKGEKVTIRLAQNEGFAIDTVEISGVDKLTWGKDSQNNISKKTATFTMPEADVVVTAKFKSTAEPSALNNVVAKEAEEAETYMLQGVKAPKGYKGIVVKGGKKYLQK
ncbi:MAG: hypothetical protein II951_09610 [Bacteroidales bacterium]|nr:hypothetical protein [Bacteroidales bacterium]